MMLNMPFSFCKDTKKIPTIQAFTKKNLYFSFFCCNFVVLKSMLMQLVFKHIATTITLICFLTATNGLNLIEHRCSTKNQSFLFLLSQNASCDVDCCLDGACCSGVLDCCENINHFTQLDADFFSTQHDFGTDTCPIFYLSHVLFAPPATCPHCGTLQCADFLGNTGVSVQLRIKQTTEFLL